MKKVMIALFLFAGAAASNQVQAQVNVSINIGNQPAWGPTGYDHVDFYYLPDANCYYDVARAQFVYSNGRSWVYARNLPARYGNVNLYNTYKVVVNRNTPYRNNRDDMRLYGRYKGNHSQAVIRDSRDSRYYASQGHPQHQRWVKDQGSNNVDNRARQTQRNNNHGNRNYSNNRNDNSSRNGQRH